MTSSLGVVEHDGKRYRVKGAFGVVTGAATGEAVAAVAGHRICPVRVIMQNSGSGTGSATLKSASTAISHAFQITSNGTTLGDGRHPIYQTEAAEALNITNTVSSANIQYHIWYIEVPE